MKKAISLIVVILLCLGLCACEDNSSSKYAGTYTANTFILAAVSEPYNGGTLHKTETVSGIRTIILNADGTGSIQFTATQQATITNQSIYDEMSKGTLTWSEDDGYLTITYHEVTYEDPNQSFSLCSTRTDKNTTYTYELKGSQLICVTNGLDYTRVK